jgi:hypothetical protein
MALAAGHVSVVEISDDDASYAALGSASDVKLSVKRDEHDTTEFTNTNENLILGLKDSSFTISGKLQFGGEKGLDLALVAFNNGSDLYVKYLPNAAAGYKVKGLVESISLPGESTSSIDFSMTVQGNGALTVVS